MASLVGSHEGLGARRAWLAPVVLGFMYLLTVLWINDVSRALEWDEAVYLSSALIDRPEIGHAAHRARGIILMALPVNLWGTSSLVPLRVWMTTLHAVAVALAAWTWQPLNSRAVIGVGLLSATWLSLFYGAELSPNLLTALLLLTSVGALANMVHRSESFWLWLASASLAIAVLTRPSDSTYWAGGLLFAFFLIRKFRQAVIPIGVGLVLGWLPWIIEAELRFGGTIERLRMAAQIVDAGPTGSFYQHLALLDGPLVGPDTSGEIPIIGILWSIFVLLIAVSALFTSRGRPAIVLLWSCAVAVGIPYIVLTGALAPRFMLPLYGALIMAATFATTRRSGKTFSNKLILGLTALVVAGFVVWHVNVAVHHNDVQTLAREAAVVIGETLRTKAAGACAFGSQYGYPQIEFYSGCDGFRVTPDTNELPAHLGQAIAAGNSVFVVLWSLPSDASPMVSWPSQELRIPSVDEDGRVWLLTPPSSSAQRSYETRSAF